ncbi:sulfur carrier protein ThiS [Coraliomargarita algicola]|uniref:Sulfur carrier protein ThiS n=1 Tax=Coraliomargarita algicola TaxID=3092156 RepID=A0ABZ0RI35_9BACT|nr:sulfur carrier protein ThiS [Coraliomargarita sp. J2-16]WPJ94763.1 sulfur carrier protein ThiS [Coraliomargarita sp. J2-16]
MKISVNDEAREVPEGLPLKALLAELGLESKPGLAVAVNQSVVPAAELAAYQLAAEDAVLIIQATQGG